MFEIEEVLWRVPIGGAVIGNAHSLNLLCKVLALRQFQELCQFAFAGDELCIGAVHEFNAAHLIERDGLKQ